MSSVLPVSLVCGACLTAAERYSRPSRKLRTSFGPSGEHTRIAYAGIVIDLLDVSRALIDAQDMTLVLA